MNYMATGRSNKLVGQTGEYLVAAELFPRGTSPRLSPAMCLTMTSCIK